MFKRFKLSYYYRKLLERGKDGICLLSERRNLAVLMYHARKEPNETGDYLRCRGAFQTPMPTCVISCWASTLVVSEGSD